MGSSEPRALVSMREYARRRGVSVEAVSKAVRSGRISVVIDEAGNRKIDPEAADRDWAKNSDPSKRRDAVAAAPAPTTTPRAAEAQVPPPGDGVLPAGGLEETQDDEADDEEGEGNANFFREKAKTERYKAKLAKLNYEERVGKLVDADRVKAQWVEVASLVRTKVLGIPAKCRQRVPDFTDEQYAALESIVREALEALSEDE